MVLLSRRIIGGGPAVIVKSATLVALMALGSVVMWLGVPLGWIWVASRLQHGVGNPSPGPYLLIAVTIPVSMILVAKALRLLDHAFTTLVGFGGEAHIPLPWTKSMRDTRGPTRGLTVLEIVMIVSVAIAGAAFGIWVAFFGGPPPSSVGNGGLHI
jgi:hypothetical protein